MQPNGKLNNTAYADHLRGCADLAIEIAARMNIHEDGARQATFATVIINAERHNVFMEPTPQHSKTPVIQPEPAAVQSDSKKGVERDEAAAAKADAQIQDIDRHPTPEKAETASRGALMDSVQSAVKLLNQAGYTPVMTPKTLNTLINDMGIPGNLGTLDIDQLQVVIKRLATILDTFKSNIKALEADAPF